MRYSMATKVNRSGPISCVQHPSHRLRFKPLSFPVSVRHKPFRLHGLVTASMGDVLDTVVTCGALSLSVGATAYTLFYNLPRSGDEKQKISLTHPEDNFTWGVMGAVSAFPLFNYMAWVLGALQSDTPRPYYWAAALYALPLLRNGLDQDWFSWTLLLLGVAHMQVLRIAATEPGTKAKLQQQLKPLALLREFADAVVKASSAATGASIGRLNDGNKQQLSAGDDRPDKIGKLLKSMDDEAAKEAMLQRLELEEFDSRLQQSDGKQRQQQQQRKQAKPTQSDWD